MQFCNPEDATYQSEDWTRVDNCLSLPGAGCFYGCRNPLAVYNPNTQKCELSKIKIEKVENGPHNVDGNDA
jgi:hypothetical protein